MLSRKVFLKPLALLRLERNGKSYYNAYEQTQHFDLLNSFFPCVINIAAHVWGLVLRQSFMKGQKISMLLCLMLQS